MMSVKQICSVLLAAGFLAVNAQALDISKLLKNGELDTTAIQQAVEEGASLTNITKQLVTNNPDRAADITSQLQETFPEQATQIATTSVTTMLDNQSQNAERDLEEAGDKVDKSREQEEKEAMVGKGAKAGNKAAQQTAENIAKTAPATSEGQDAVENITQAVASNPDTASRVIAAAAQNKNAEIAGEAASRGLANAQKSGTATPEGLQEATEQAKAQITEEVEDEDLRDEILNNISNIEEDTTEQISP